METKAEYTTVCTDELTALILEVQDAGYNLAESCQWGTGRMQSTEAAGKARAALREYVDALVKGGITAQIADLLEQVAALQERIESLEYTKDAYWQVIQAKTERVAELEKAIIESGIKVDILKSELRERDE